MGYLVDEMTKAEGDYVMKELIHYADRFTGPRNVREFGYALRDDTGGIVGGISGNMIWDWLQIGALWVAEGLRRKGFGSQLLERAERAAVADGCRFSRLNTFEFEARAFYESHGYEVHAQTRDFPVGHTQYHLSKRL